MTDKVKTTTATIDKKEKNKADDPYAFLNDFENAPAREDMEAWKDLYGDIFVTPLGKNEIYVFRKITRLEWKNILKQMREAAAAGADVDEFTAEDYVVRKCLLYPKWDVNFKNTSSAGTISTLQKQILLVSNFMDEQEAAKLIIQL